MKFFSYLTKFFQKIFPPTYGIYEKGSFPTHRKLSLRQAKKLILAGGKKGRWEKETEFTFSFLKENFLEKNKNRQLLIVDYGIGIGRLALPILRDYPKTKIIGVDESVSMLELAKKWLPEVFFNEKRIELLTPDQFFGKYEEKTFDLILAVYVFQHIFLRELRKILPALHQLLKDDGKIFIVNTFKNDDPLNREVIIKDLLRPYFEKEIEISPYENKENYIFWMSKTGAGYGDWQKMEKAKPRCQKFMGLYRKRQFLFAGSSNGRT
ncbi:MAG: class I SAM-dependent methyltransferase [Patescibacteria group bacterium]